MKLRIAVVGYGNIGRFTVEALETAPDMEIAGIVRRTVGEKPLELTPYPVAVSYSHMTLPTNSLG